MKTSVRIDAHKSVHGLVDFLNKQFVEREALIQGSMIALLAGKHVFSLGIPGTAKSAICRAICSAVRGAQFFRYQLSMTSRPEDLFGPPMLSKLKQDSYERNTTGMMPEADIVFLDEIWKAGGAILDTLLKLTDESREFSNGSRGSYRTPIMSVFSASNELPEVGRHNALYDRFVLRYVIGDIVDDSNFKYMLVTRERPVYEKFSIKALHQAQNEIRNRVRIDDVPDMLLRLRAKLKQEGLTFSPRRWNESSAILAAHAWYDNRDWVTAEDLQILEHVFWNVPDDRHTASRIVMSMVDPDYTTALGLLEKTEELHKAAMEAFRFGNDQSGSEANEKIRRHILPALLRLPRNKRIEAVREQITKLHREVLEQVMGSALEPEQPQ